MSRRLYFHCLSLSVIFVNAAHDVVGMRAALVRGEPLDASGYADMRLRKLAFRAHRLFARLAHIIDLTELMVFNSRSRLAHWISPARMA